jgi:L-rhamnose-H+ transport protein
MMLGLSLIVSNVVAWFAGEWKGVRKPFQVLLLGVFLIIVATVLMSYASTLKGG